MNLKILLTGKNGQVGSELLHLLPRVGEVVAFDRHQLDLAKPDEIRQVIRGIRPNLIVNAAAYTAVDQAEKEKALAHSINAEAPGVIAQEAKKIGASIVHYSTDYIFDGLKQFPYEETDVPNPVSVYGKTKLAGEVAIRDSGVSHLIFRIAWVYSTTGRNFLLTVLRIASQREELKIVRDQVGAPTWCRDIASATTQILAGGRAREQSDTFPRKLQRYLPHDCRRRCVLVRFCAGHCAERLQNIASAAVVNRRHATNRSASRAASSPSPPPNIPPLLVVRHIPSFQLRFSPGHSTFNCPIGAPRSIAFFTSNSDGTSKHRHYRRRSSRLRNRSLTFLAME